MSYAMSIASSDAMSDLSKSQLEGDANEEGAVGLSDAKVSQRRRRMLDLTNRLHSTGVQLDIDLPQIAVIGSQSAGKSSLIESISGIKLPRASGTCTRCPTECRLSHSSSHWQCSVSLRYTTDAHGNSLKQVRNEQFGPPITDRNEVEERLRRAQRAILNPGTDVKVFLDGEDADPSVSELTFSSNCVSVQISGTDVADLSFCDLPGLIASVARGKTSDMALVEKLLISYIDRPSCLILLTVACEADFETQGAYSLAQKFDPDGKRTTGVLTKPDRIPSGDESTWVPYIENEEVPLELGWYCVKQPDSKQLKSGISWSQARANEKLFFQETEPWCSLPFGAQQHLGTQNLVEHLSETLSDLISKRLPELQDELEGVLEGTMKSLSELPIPPSADPLSEMMHLIGNFSRDVTNRIEGTPDEDGLIQSIRPKQEIFKRAIRAMAPDFRPYERSTIDKDKPELPAMDFLSNEDEDVSVRSTGKIIYIDEVMERAKRARTRELPDNYPFIVTQALIEQIIGNWQKPAQAFFDAVNVILLKHVKELIRTHFVRYGQGGLLESVQMIVFEHVKKCQEQTKKQMEWLHRLESRPFTLNTHYLADYKDKFLTYYKGCRQKQENSTLMANIESYTPHNGNARYSMTTFQEGMSKVMSGLNQVGISGTKPADLPKLLPPDPFDPALEIMASVRAYFQVAYKRFADNIPLAVDHDFVRALGKDIESVLFKGIMCGTDPSKRCKTLLQESPVTSSRREELQKKRERLETAKQELMELW